jgi:hypothetical protein
VGVGEFRRPGRTPSCPQLGQMPWVQVHRKTDVRRHVSRQPRPEEVVRNWRNSP